ncbi:MAG: hypothetical protein ACXIUB_05115 [Wenzhouxiangella sp.]
MCGHGTHRFPLLECLLASRCGQPLPVTCHGWLSRRNTEHLARTLSALLALLARDDELALDQLARQICCCLHHGECAPEACQQLFADDDRFQAEWLIQAAALLVAEARWPKPPSLLPTAVLA